MKNRRYTIHDSPEGSMVIMIGSSRVEDRDPLLSSRRIDPSENDMSSAPDPITFTCTMLDDRTQRPCDKAFSRRTDLKRPSKAIPSRSGEEKNFQYVPYSNMYSLESWLQRHVRKEQRACV